MRYISQLVSNDPPQKSPSMGSDARQAVAALFVRIARADGVFDTQERLQIEKLLSTRYSLSHEKAQELMQHGMALEAEASDTVQFTRVIKEAVPYEEREALLENFWSVALSNGERAAEEDTLLRLSAHLLGISDRDSALARQRAASKS